MTTTNVEQRVNEIVMKVLDIKDASKVTKEARFIDDLGADSLDTVDIIMEFEEAFSIEIPDDDAAKIVTVGDAIHHIKEHLDSQKATASV
ncbi:MAG: acyl carrier protein [Alphaproteobacteria bacterium]|nr:acyl carrier protein [Alphaproteobacteria bacterium]